VQEAQAAEEVQHVPHLDKLRKGVDKETVKGIKMMNMHGPARDSDAGQMTYKTEVMQPISSEQKDSMSKEQLLNKFFVLKRRVKELEDMTLKQQTEITEESRLALPNIRGKFSLVDNLPEKIQIHQDEIERLKKENNQLLQGIHRGVEERLLENTTGATGLVEKILPSRRLIQGDQVDEAPSDIHGGVLTDGGGEVQGHQEDHHQDDAWQKVLPKVETMPLDTTVTFVNHRKTGNTAAECKAFGKACIICNKLHQMATVCFQRPTNIVVVTSNEEDARNTNKKYKMYNTPDEIAAEETEEKDNKVPVDLD
jgi:hypothetical protein